MSKPLFKDAHFLLWAQGRGEPDFQDGLIIDSGTHGYFNIAYMPPKTAQMNIPSNEWLDLYNTPLKSGMYVFSIEVSGTGCGPLLRKFTSNSTVTMSSPYHEIRNHIIFSRPQLRGGASPLISGIGVSEFHPRRLGSISRVSRA
ncbi:MAG: hypothetical protein AB1508_15950 [Pseudomonadota bacterium]